MRTFLNLVVIGGTLLLSAGAACAQAPPGPLPPPAVSANSGPPPPPVRRIEPRKTIYGDWKLNRDESDDPRSKMHQAKANTNRNTGMGTPRVGWPGGGGGMGGYGGNHPNQNPQADTSETNEKIQALIDPSVRLNFSQKAPKDAEIELTGDQGKRMVFYTDGKKPDKPSDANQQQVSARWDGPKLVTEEDLAKNGKLSRTYELSEDGLQLFEEVHLDTGKKKDLPVTIRYVYDAVSPDHAG